MIRYHVFGKKCLPILVYYIVKYTTSKSPRSDYPKSYEDQITVFKLFYTCLIIRYYNM